MPTTLTILASGSAGNAALVRTPRGALLIDCGLSLRALTARLVAAGSSWAEVRGVVLTHTHGDHWNEAVLRKLAVEGIDLYCHPDHRDDLRQSGAFKVLWGNHCVKYYDAGFEFGPIRMPGVIPLPLLHDCGPTFGFRVTDARGRSLAYLADLGTWTPGLADALAGVDVLAVEFNHDVAMQVGSGRPDALIERNLGDLGHLSNAQGAALVRAILERSGRPDALRHLALLHLSHRCNRPDVAWAEAWAALRACGHRAHVHVAEQGRVSPAMLVGGLTIKPGASSDGY